MTRNLKALGLALLAICAMGALAAQGASAAKEHEFHSDGEKTVIIGGNIEGNDKFQVGAAGTVECTSTKIEATQVGEFVSTETYKSDTLTVVPKYTGCTFGGQPATVNFNHCAYVFDSDTGETEGKEHANVDIECAKNEKGEDTKIEIDTSVCTITVGPQQVTHAVRYSNGTASSIRVETTAKKVVTGKAKTTEAQTGCLLFPTGAIGSYTGIATSECFKDAGETETGTAKTTPTLVKGATTKCTVTNV